MTTIGLGWSPLIQDGIAISAHTLFAGNFLFDIFTFTFFTFYIIFLPILSLQATFNFFLIFYLKCQLLCVPGCSNLVSFFLFFMGKGYHKAIALVPPHSRGQCEPFCCRLSSWDNVSERKNLGFLYAVDHGAEEVVDLAQKEGLPPVHLMEEGYIPVTYPTGLLWNPYPSMLGTPDLWPKGFPAELREVKQEVLNEEMERVPATSIGIVQSLPRPSTPSIPHPLTLPPLLALGLKTFAPLADSTTLFTKSALWALFLPNHQSSSATLRGLFAQPLLWRVGLYTAFSLATLSDQQLEEGPDSEDDFDDIDVRLLQALRQTNFSTTCTTVASCLKLIYSQHHKTGQSHLEAWLFDLKQIGYQTPQLRPHKQFAYLTQVTYLGKPH